VVSGRKRAPAKTKIVAAAPGPDNAPEPIEETARPKAVRARKTKPKTTKPKTTKPEPTKPEKP
jgi:hypothetical protein